MRKKILRSFGKVILVGEHAVVYGKLALAAQISRGVRVQVVEGKVVEKTDIVKKAIGLGGGNEKINLKIKSELPIGSGLGSSAAVAAATIKAVREHLGKAIEDDELFELTMKCEELAHGKPSGIDAATVVYGGLIAFVKGQPFERLEMKKPTNFVLVDTGKPSESTKEMVEIVASKSNKDRIIDEIGEIANKVKEEIVRERDISKLLNQNGLLLEQLGVVGEKAKKLSRELRELGASVKITGAGGVKTGSGMMIVMHNDLTKIGKFLDNKQISYFETMIGEK